MSLRPIFYGLLFASASLGVQAGGISADQMGLSKTSVFDAPTPEAAEYPAAMPGAAPSLPPAYPGAPPLIPHSVKGLVPITSNNNACKGCHDHPQFIGQAAPGIPTSIPRSHYVNSRTGKANPGQKLDGSRYVCTQCHVPQSNAKPLVANEFKTN